MTVAGRSVRLRVGERAAGRAARVSRLGGTEAELYPPVKRLLERQGYEVKGEVGACDVVAVRDSAAPVIVELKRSFSLELVFQGVARQRLSDRVYLAAVTPGGRAARRRRKDARTLCRRLGLGLIWLGPEGAPPEIAVDPGPVRPRRDRRSRERLLLEFERRVGDPNCGGTSPRPRVTAYRQDALRCARALGEAGPLRAARVRDATGVARAQRILQRDVYGWFERVERGVYALTPRGRAALVEFADVLRGLARTAPAPLAVHFRRWPAPTSCCAWRG